MNKFIFCNCLDADYYMVGIDTFKEEELEVVDNDDLKELLKEKGLNGIASFDFNDEVFPRRKNFIYICGDNVIKVIDKPIQRIANLDWENLEDPNKEEVIEPYSRTIGNLDNLYNALYQ